MGWVLRTQGIDTAKYKYFLFMNSSARGPFLPSYWPNTVHWTQPLVSRLRGLVKLVGPTISCEGERNLLGTAVVVQDLPAMSPCAYHLALGSQRRLGTINFRHA